MGPCMGAAWGCTGAQRGAVQGRSSVGLRRGAAWGGAGAQQRGAEKERGAGQGHSTGQGRGVRWGCARAQ